MIQVSITPSSMHFPSRRIDVIIGRLIFMLNSEQKNSHALPIHKAI